MWVCVGVSLCVCVCPGAPLGRQIGARFRSFVIQPGGTYKVRRIKKEKEMPVAEKRVNGPKVVYLPLCSASGCG